MGRYYYDLEHDEEKHDPLKRIEHIQIANAIGDHYRPIGPRDSCPDAPESIVVALADKIDTLVAFFAIALPPTGSRDPFALRRAALGIIRILIEKSVRLPLKDALTKAGEIFYGQREPSLRDRVPALYAELIGFIVDRLKVHLRDQGVRHDLIGAAFMQGGKAESDLVRLRKRVDALEAFLVSEDGANLLIAFRRASNIVVIEERGGESYDDAVNPALLRQAEERALFERLAKSPISHNSRDERANDEVGLPVWQWGRRGPRRHEELPRRQRCRPRRDEQSGVACSAGLYDHDGGLHLLLRARQVLSGGFAGTGRRQPCRARAIAGCPVWGCR